MKLSSTHRHRVIQAAWTAGFGLAAWLAVIFFLRVFAPAEHVPVRPFNRDYDRSGMQAALAPGAVGDTLAAIEALGSRAPGQAGHAAVGRLLEARFRAAGLEVFRQEIDTVYPLAEQAALTLGGERLPVGLWPAPPNHVQPMTTPPEGLSGELMLVTETNLRQAVRFDDKIALVDLSRPLFRELGLAPGRYCELGFRAMIVTHADGLDRVAWRQLEDLRMNLPLNYARLVADPAILEAVGRRVRLDVRTAYRSVPTTNLVAVLRAPGPPAAGAVVISVSQDGFSLLPDLVHGSFQALQMAIQLRLLEGLAPHRDALQRDVVFVATSGDYTAQNSLNRLLSTVGPYDQRGSVRERLVAERAEHEGRLGTIGAIAGLLADPAFGAEAAASAAGLRRLAPADQAFFEEQFRYVLRRRVFDASEPLLQARIRFERHPEDLAGEPYQAFRAAKRHYDRLNSQAALPLPRYLERRDRVAGDDVRAAIGERLAELRGFHEVQLRRVAQEEALHKVFSGYGELLVIAPSLMPPRRMNGRETLGFTGGSGVVHTEAADTFRRMLQDAAFALGLQEAVAVDFRGLNHGSAMNSVLGGLPIHALPWSQLSYPAFSMIAPQGDYSEFFRPLPHPATTNLRSIAGSLQVLGEATLSAARGYGAFGRLPRYSPYSLRGMVYASGIGNSVVPNYPVAGALICSKEDEGRYGRITAAYQRKPLFFTDPYGRYSQPLLSAGTFFGWSDPTPLSAVWFDAQGRIAYCKDEGLNAQNMYQSRAMAYDGAPVHLVLYRGDPVAVLNRVNPQSMRAFTDVEFLRARELTPFPSAFKFTVGDGFLNFLPPEERFFAALKAGSPDNEQVAVTRAFCLNTRDPAFVPDPESEIDGPGYLAQDTPVLRNVPAEAAASMAFLAGKRLELQRRHGMVDEMTDGFHARARQSMAAAGEAARGLLARLRDYRQAMAYQILNHPVIRGSIAEAVWGILWYMGLLVPFIFFFEKLVFGFPDIRKQLTAQGVIFLVVFVLLRLLHPAFQMIRSSLMILLGFVIILISGGITLVLSAKFRENIEALRSAQGAVKGAEVNKAGVMLTAFMLGLNNMHKRKVRTGLTCATLVLMTFVMISFTSVQSNIVDKVATVGQAAYQGILVREPRFLPISASEVSALDSRHGALFTVNDRATVVGTYSTVLGRGVTPEFEVVHGAGGGASRETARAALLLRQTEPLGRALRLLGTNGWFTAAQAASMDAPPPVLLSDAMAEGLGITPAAVDAGGVQVRINGLPYAVHNLFAADSLEQVRDLDGDNLLPYDAEALVSPQVSAGSLLADRDDPRVPASLTLITLNHAIAVPSGGALRTLSVAIDMGQAVFATARHEITAYLEQTGRETSYGLDGTAYLGRRAREQSLSGLVDLLIPLVIAALTVLNTMKGSVYERRSEIFVYNAVGIAPRYIFFMFVAEAMVYAVVGSMLGYLLSQGVGRALTALGWTGGMNMNFTSLATVYASLAIAAATLLSTWFP
ncbi:MAG: ABC transporter permease, partial [Lentisphaerae bacterium]|nr:ABC transporter permease [Lentisphaerota bacterium]